jgi:hypothetical protein
MNTIKAMEGGYLTERVDMPTEERSFYSEVTGINATWENYREATEEEVRYWNDLLARLGN